MLAVAYCSADRLEDAVATIDLAMTEAATAFARTDPNRTDVESAAELIHTAAARGPWEPAPIAPTS
jgi:hypothetical protein